MIVPFLDLSAATRELREELDGAYARVQDRGWYILGSEVEAFEREFAAYCEARHAVGVGNGLDALEIALRAAGIGPGDDVIVPAHTFIATWLAVDRAGATIVAADVDPETLNLDADAARAAMSERTRAIVPVSLYGRPAGLEPLGPPLIEDAAQAHGAQITSGVLAATYSFYPAKNLGALGDGGALVTNDDDLAERARWLRNYGSARKYDHVERGFNSRLDELQAAFLRVKLAILDEWNARRARIAATYHEGLQGLAELTLPPQGGSVWHLYVIRHPRRDELQRHLTALGVQTQVHYPHPCHRTPVYAHVSGRFPVAEEAAATCLSLPIGPHLSDEQVQAVIGAVRAYSSST